MIRCTRACVLPILIFFLALICQNAFAKDVKTIRINQAFQSLLYLPLYVAAKKDFFDDEGVNVIIDTGGGAAKSWSAVLGGSADFSLHDPVFVPISNAEGASAVVVAGVQNAASVWIVGNNSTKLKGNLSLLKGKTVTTMPKPDTTWAFFAYMLKSHGLGLNYSKINQVAVGAALAPLMVGRSDYSLLTEPQVSKAVSQGKHIVFSYADDPEWFPYAFSSIVTTKDRLTKDQDATQKMVNALQRASVFIHRHPKKAIKIAQSEFPNIDKDIVAEAVKREISANAYPKDVLVTKKAWSHAMRTADFVDIIDAAADTSSYAHNVNTKFAKKAMELYPSD